MVHRRSSNFSSSFAASASSCSNAGQCGIGQDIAREIMSRHGHVVSDEFRGTPDAVVDRFRTLHKMDLLLDALPPEQVDDTQWTGHMQ